MKTRNVGNVFQLDLNGKRVSFSAPWLETEKRKYSHTQHQRIALIVKWESIMSLNGGNLTQKGAEMTSAIEKNV